MTPAEAATILALCSAYDRRTVGEADARAWSQALDDIDHGDAQEAVVRHYRTRRDWIMPADVRQAVGEIRGERIRNYGQFLPRPPRQVDGEPASFEWERGFRTAIAAGCTERDADVRACKFAGIGREDDDPLVPIFPTADLSGERPDVRNHPRRDQISRDPRLVSMVESVARAMPRINA